MSMDQSKTKAVIYCRVSNVKQTTRGNGLASQETRCREYANYKGYEVIEVYQDDVSGGLIDRPGMQAMLGHLRRQRKDPHIVIIDDISRLARGIEAHLQLRAAIGKAGGVLESPSVEFGEDSDSILVENLLASVSQHQRQKNGEQTKNRMRGRVMNGYWVFQAPIGYRYERVTGHGKLLIRNEPVASIITEALEGYASGRFQTQAEVKRFLESQPYYPKDLPNGEIRYERVRDLLRRPIYAGYIEVPKWDVKLRKGHHEPLVSFECYQKIQERLTDTPKVPAKTNLHADFPLRGFVTCGDCGKPLSGAWSKGRSQRYAYYMCFERGCVSNRKSIRKDELETAFEALLDQAQPAEGLCHLVFDMFKDLWERRLSQSTALVRMMKDELKKLDKQVSQLLDRIVDASSDTLISAYEKRVTDLEKRQIELKEKITENGKPKWDFDETFRTAIEFLSNPHRLWDSDRIEDKRAVLKLTFADKLAYVRNEGFRTAALTLPFKVLSETDEGENKMARPRGFEPLTSASGGQRSIQLSYGRFTVSFSP